MITRRDVIKWGVVAPALLGGTQAAFAKVPEGLDALVLDDRFSLDDEGTMRAPKLYHIDGDVTSLWYEVLDPVWRKRGFMLGGITGRDALFVLETLAADRGRRVVSRKALPARDGQGEGPVSWVIAPVHPSVRA